MTNIGTTGGKSASQKKSKHWIEFRFKDKDTGNLIKGIKVVVMFSDGSRHEISTWTSGRARFEYIPEGPCDLVSCVKGHELLEEKETYTLKDKDTLHDIADKQAHNGNDITWGDIAAYNWGEDARDPHVANQHMRDKYRCTRYLFWKDYSYKEKTGKTDTIIIPKRINRSKLAIDKVYEIQVKTGLTPPQFLGCTGIPNVTFETMRSFIRPNAAPYLNQFKKTIKANPSAMLMVFGHSDKVGTPEFNKALSERRANSAYALLTRKPDTWITYFKDGDGDHEGWGLKSVQVILNYLNAEAKLDLTNQMDPRTINELEKYVKPAWQNTNGRKIITDNALKKIFQIYMDKLMDGTTLSEQDFFSLRHVGCGKFNPIIDIDNDEEENRRVTFFLFDQNRLPELPCSNKDMEPCKDQSAQYQSSPRHTYRHNDSFSCAFYDSIARECEGEMKLSDIIAIDSHMHFMSGHCTPMPLLWNQLPGKPQLKRTSLDKVGGWALRYTVGKIPIPAVAGTIEGTWTQRQSTLAIADIGIAQNESIYKSTYSKDLSRTKGRELFTPMLAMPMDMAYAHIDGYKGIPIYHLVLERKFFMMDVPTPEGEPVQEKVLIWPDDICKDRDDLTSEAKVRKEYPDKPIITEKNKTARREGFYYFWSRNCVLEDQDILCIPKYNASQILKKRTPVWLADQERDLFEDWAAQREATLTAAIKHPFQYMPLYHYEPRRWSALDNLDKVNLGPQSPYESVRMWDEPFEDIATPDKPGAFVGFKMYTALGYKPLDPKLEKTLTHFYEKCQKDGIPIMCHCSPSGMYSHDRSFYFEGEDRAYREKYMTNKMDFPKFWKKYESFDKVKGFYDMFVRPTAWEKQVLSKYPTLKLCLAHFGGGSSEWKTWKEDTEKKAAKLKFIYKNRYGNPHQTLTPDDMDILIASWYNRYEPKDKRTYKGKEPLPHWYYQFFGADEELDKKKESGNDPNPWTWIRDFVRMMETYGNFHTDISYHFVEDHHRQLAWLLKEYPHIKDRILFGTDWYMTELESRSINSFVHAAKEAIDGITKQLETETNIKDDLWIRFSRINPMAFYGIRGIADNFAKGLREGVITLKNKSKAKVKDNKTKNSNMVDLNNSALERNLEIIKRSDLF